MHVVSQLERKAKGLPLIPSIPRPLVLFALCKARNDDKTDMANTGAGFTTPTRERGAEGDLVLPLTLAGSQHGRTRSATSNSPPIRMERPSISPRKQPSPYRSLAYDQTPLAQTVTDERGSSMRRTHTTSNGPQSGTRQSYATRPLARVRLSSPSADLDKGWR